MMQWKALACDSDENPGQHLTTIGEDSTKSI